MASGGNNFSARISAEDQKIDYNALRKIAHKHFIQHKVEISDAIKKVFPFLEILRDREFITNKTYEESYKSFQKSLPIEKVVYDVLQKLEKKFNLPLLDTLFCKVIMKSYPDLNGIREGFRYVIIEKICQEARDRERSAENLNTPLSLDQGIGKNLYETLPWLAPDPSSDNDVHGEFIYPLGGQAVTNPMLALDSGTATAEHGTSEDHLEIQEISANEAGTTSDNEQHAQESVPAGERLEGFQGFSAEQKRPGACSSAVTSLEGFPGFSTEKKAPGACSSEVRSLEGSSGSRAEEKRPGACRSAVRSLEGSSGSRAEEKRPGACSSAVRSLEGSSGSRAEEKRPGACSSAVRSLEGSSGSRAEEKRPGACSSAVRSLEGSLGFSADKKPPGACSSAVRSLEGPSGFRADKKPPGAYGSAVRSLEGSSGLSADKKPPGACSSAVRSLEGPSGFRADKKPPGACGSAVRSLEGSSGLSADKKAPGACKSAVRSLEGSLGFSADKKPPGACSSEVRSLEGPSGFRADKKPPGARSSAVRSLEGSLGFSADKKAPGACSSAVRSLEGSSGFRADKKPPGACGSAVRSLEGSSGLSADKKPPGACSSAVRSLEGSLGFSADKEPPGARSSAVRSLEGSLGFSADKKPPGACGSAMISLEGSLGFSADKKPPGACGSAVRSLEGSSGFGVGKKPPGACSSAVRSLEGSSGFRAEEKPPGSCDCTLRSCPDKKGTVGLGNNSTVEKAKRKRRARNHEEESVDFSSEILPVTCGEKQGMLFMKMLEQGTTTKCILSQDGTWFTPREFEIEGGYQKSSNWKTSLRCGGKTLKCLMEAGKITTLPGKGGKKKKLGNSDICEICQYGENLFCCDTCSKFFHGDCHLPPVEPERSPWSCTFCRMKASSRSQQCLRESEVLARQMGPEEQLKCDFLLLELYCHSESKEAVPPGCLNLETVECMKDLLMLNEIKKKLSERGYPKVEGFIQAVRHIFQVHRASKTCNNFCWGIRLEAKFEQHFKEVFAVQETKQEHTNYKIKLEKDA